MPGRKQRIALMPRSTCSNLIPHEPASAAGSFTAPRDSDDLPTQHTGSACWKPPNDWREKSAIGSSLPTRYQHEAPNSVTPEMTDRG